MNVFYLAKNTKECATYHVDRHTTKMILETAQLLSTAHHVLDGHNAPKGIYKKTHVNHPSAIWARKSAANYNWLYCLFTDLCEEYTHRYDKKHLTETKMRDTGILNLPPWGIAWDVPFTEPPQCMPDQYKVPNDSIAAYRNYYRDGKAHLLQYTNRNKPEWL